LAPVAQTAALTIFFRFAAPGEPQRSGPVTAEVGERSSRVSYRSGALLITSGAVDSTSNCGRCPNGYVFRLGGAQTTDIPQYQQRMSWAQTKRLSDALLLAVSEAGTATWTNPAGRQPDPWLRPRSDSKLLAAIGLGERFEVTLPLALLDDRGWVAEPNLGWCVPAELNVQRNLSGRSREHCGGTRLRPFGHRWSNPRPAIDTVNRA